MVNKSRPLTALGIAIFQSINISFRSVTKLPVRYHMTKEFVSSIGCATDIVFFRIIF